MHNINVVLCSASTSPGGPSPVHLLWAMQQCNALLQQEAENTVFSLFFLLVQRYLHPPHELLEWSRTEIDCGDSGELCCGTQDTTGCCNGAGMQNWGKQANPTLCYSTHQSRCLSMSGFSRQITSAGMREKASSTAMGALPHLCTHHSCSKSHQSLTQMVQWFHDLQRCIMLLFHFGTGLVWIK